MALENSFETYITVCKIACESVMYDAGKAKPKLCDDLEGQGGEVSGTGVQDGGAMHIPMANPC